jgi:hypothetical protein
MPKKFYPSPSSTTYYINEYLLSDMYRVDFKRDVRKQPIYGYDSKQFDFVAKGKELVTGQLVVNYRYPGYLRNVIKQAASRDASVADHAHRKLLKRSKEGARTEALSRLSVFDSTALVQDKAKVIAEALSQREVKTEGGDTETTVAPRLRPDLVFQIMKENLENRHFMDRLELDESEISTMSSPLDRSHDPFDIIVRYGFQGVAGGYARMFRDVHLIGESQSVTASAGISTAGDGLQQSSSAMPILEVYPFFARTVEVRRYEG